MLDQYNCKKLVIFFFLLFGWGLEEEDIASTNFNASTVNWLWLSEFEP